MSNILPKKSWHVYNEDNRERVRKDEAEAKKEQDKLQSRAESAEREHRLALLRARALANASAKSETEKTSAGTSKAFTVFDQDANTPPVVKQETDNSTIQRTKTKSLSDQHYLDDPLANYKQ